MKKVTKEEIRSRAVKYNQVKRNDLLKGIIDLVNKGQGIREEVEVVAKELSCKGGITKIGKYQEPLCKNCIESQETDPVMKVSLVEDILAKDKTRDYDQLIHYSNGTLIGILMFLNSEEPKKEN